MLGFDDRRLGTVLLVFGLVGVALAGVIALALVGGATAARNLDDRLEADQAQLAALLGRTTDTIDMVATSASNASTTLATTSTALGNVGAVVADVAAVSEELASALLAVSILGNQPLATAGARFSELAAQVRTLQADTQALSANLATNASDVDALVSEVRELEDLVEELAGRVAAFDRTGEIVNLIVGGILLLGLLVAWLAVAAGACAFIGWRLRRGRRATST